MHLSTLASLANKILDEIAQYLPTASDQYSLMCCCRGLHWPAARQLYQHVSVLDYKARRFFKTITESTVGYEYFIQRLEYRATSSTDVHLTHVLLRDAIPRLRNIIELNLFIRSSLSPFLIYILKRTEPLNTFRGLAKLQNFRLHGDIRLLKLINYDNVSKIEMSDGISLEEFASFVDAVIPKETGKNLKVTNLLLTLNDPPRRHVIYIFFRVAELFPNLQRFSLRGSCIEALDISQLMTLNPPLFPGLKELLINQISLIMPEERQVVGGNPFKIQQTHIIEASRLRMNLQHITFGNVAWDRALNTNTWKMSYGANATEEDLDLLPENFRTRPVEWLVVYSEPVDRAELQVFHAKRFPITHV